MTRPAIRLMQVVVVMVVTLQASAIFGRSGVIARAKHPVPGEYIILFEKSVPSAAARAAIAASSANVVVHFPDINGYYVRNLGEPAALALSQRLDVASIEENAVIEVADTATNLLTPLSAGDGGAVNATRWGLDRLDQNWPRSIPRLDTTYTWCYNGVGVRIYVLDTGVMSHHPEFGGSITTSVTVAESTASQNGRPTASKPCTLISASMLASRFLVAGSFARHCGCVHRSGQ